MKLKDFKKKKDLKGLEFLNFRDTEKGTYSIYRYKGKKLVVLFKQGGSKITDIYIEMNNISYKDFKGKEYEVRIIGNTPQYSFYKVTGKKWLLREDKAGELKKVKHSEFEKEFRT